MMDTYVLDSDALINLHEHFSGQFNKLRRLAQNGRLAVPEGVYRELNRTTGKLFKNLDKWKERNPSVVVFVRRQPRLASEFTRIEMAYGEKIEVGGKEYNGFWKSRAGKRAADGQVVAIGRVHGHIVVSDDRAVGLACMLENVKCIGWKEFARRIGMVKQAQLF